jgi:hypothetical protein
VVEEAILLDKSAAKSKAFQIGFVVSAYVEIVQDALAMGFSLANSFIFSTSVKSKIDISIGDLFPQGPASAAA